MLLLAPLLHLLQQPSHLPTLLLLTLPQELLRGRVGLVTHPQRVLHDAQHGQDVGDAHSHRLEEEKGEKGLSGAGWEGDGGWGSGGRRRRGPRTGGREGEGAGRQQGEAR